MSKCFFNVPCSHFYLKIIEQEENEQFDNIYDENNRHINHWFDLYYQ